MGGSIFVDNINIEDLSRDNVAKLANEMEIRIGGWDSSAYTDENSDILAEVIRTTTSLEWLGLIFRMIKSSMLLPKIAP